MSLASLKLGVISGLFGLVAASGAASRPAKPDTSMLVSTDWLAKNLADPSVVVLVVDRNDSAYKAGHVPGARYLPYATLGQTIDGIQLELPSPDSIKNLFESLGVSNSSHVVLTGRPLTVTRAFYTLDYIGMQHVSALDGGFTKWKREGARARRQCLRSSARHITPAPPPKSSRRRRGLDRVGKKGFSFIDTRTDSEYIGIGAAAACAALAISTVRGVSNGRKRSPTRMIFRRRVSPSSAECGTSASRPAIRSWRTATSGIERAGAISSRGCWDIRRNSMTVRTTSGRSSSIRRSRPSRRSENLRRNARCEMARCRTGVSRP